MRSDLTAKEREILEKLKEVKDPEFGRPIYERQLIDDVRVTGHAATIEFHLTVPFCPDVFATYIGKEIKRKALEVEGIKEVEVRVIGHNNAEQLNAAFRAEHSP